MSIKLNRGALVIDCYHRDGDPDFDLLAEAGLKGVFLKASQGNSTWISWLQRNALAAKAAGLLVGAYHFADPSIGADHQANVLYDACRGFDCPLGYALDVEPCLSGGVDRWTRLRWDAPSQFVRALVDGLRGWGVESPVVYASPSFWKERICSPSSAKEDAAREACLKGCRSWVARYGVSHAPTQLEGFEGEHPWLWQYTETGKMKGFNGNIDLSRVVA